MHKAIFCNILSFQTFVKDADAGFSVEGLDDTTDWIYTRWGNPTIHRLEEKLAALEHTEAAIAFCSGMGAITALLFNTLHSGDHAIVGDVAYAALSKITVEMILKLGILITKADTSDQESIKKALTPKRN